ncbi:putative adhesin, partial [Mycobacteroides abscessus]
AVVPEGTSVTVFGEHGGTITDALGNRIETGQDVAGVFSRTYTAGEEMPNYTLHPPEGLDIQGTPHTV